MSINTLVINIFTSYGEVQSPIYNIDSFEKAEEIINATRTLIAEGSDPESTFSFAIQGSVA